MLSLTFFNLLFLRKYYYALYAPKLMTVMAIYFSVLSASIYLIQNKIVCSPIVTFLDCIILHYSYYFSYQFIVNIKVNTRTLNKCNKNALFKCLKCNEYDGHKLPESIHHLQNVKQLTK